MFELPPGLARLIAVGVWPSAAGPSMTAQQLRPSIPAERVRRFAAEESVICLQPPPFPTVAQERAGSGVGDFWERFGALDQIDPARAVIIGDFGLGSDSPVVLDFGRDASNPPVLRLRWGPRGVGNEWVQGARDFDEFAAMLGLGQTHAEPGDAAQGRCQSVGVQFRSAVAAAEPFRTAKEGGSKCGCSYCRGWTAPDNCSPRCFRRYRRH